MEALETMPGYVKFMKDLVTKKWTVSFELLIICTIIMLLPFDLSLKRRRMLDILLFHILLGLNFVRALFDIAANINLISLVVYK